MADIKKIKELRELTGAGFLDCSKSLDASSNDIQDAIAWLQENGKAKAAKKALRIAAEGVVKAVVTKKSASLIELNSETDFVAKNKSFVVLANQIAMALADADSIPEDVQTLKIEGKTILELTEQATATIGEKISFRRYEKFVLAKGQSAGAYTHFDGQKASLVVVEGVNEESTRDLAMHVAAMNPKYLNEFDVPAKRVKALKDKFKESPALAGKPENIQENILAGLLRKALSEDTFEEQEFVVDGGMTVKKYAASKKLKILSIARFEVGEGIEKSNSDFVAEVQEQMSNINK